jgi:hypothetical protein
MKLFAKLLGRGCTHHFSWPRTDANGRQYQICLACGAAYEYDWVAMKQTGRLLKTPAPNVQQVMVPHH